jgi:hypothetical protein
LGTDGDRDKIQRPLRNSRRVDRPVTSEWARGRGEDKEGGVKLSWRDMIAIRLGGGVGKGDGFKRGGGGEGGGGTAAGMAAGGEVCGVGKAVEEDVMRMKQIDDLSWSEVADWMKGLDIAQESIDVVKEEKVPKLN